MARIFVILTVVGMVLAQAIYGGNPLEAMDHLQLDLLNLLPYFPLLLIPVCFIAWNVGRNQRHNAKLGAGPNIS